MWLAKSMHEVQTDHDWIKSNIYKVNQFRDDINSIALKSHDLQVFNQSRISSGKVRAGYLISTSWVEPR